MKERGKEVIFDGEHFFDGWKGRPGLRPAGPGWPPPGGGGADVLCLCDTNGGRLPPGGGPDRGGRWPGVFDLPVAVPLPRRTAAWPWPTAWWGLLAGASQVQGTLLGFGERCGKRQPLRHHPRFTGEAGHPLYPPGAAAAVVPRGQGDGLHRQPGPAGQHALRGGQTPLAHKAGMHADGVLKVPRSFEHVDPYRGGQYPAVPRLGDQRPGGGAGAAAQGLPTAAAGLPGGQGRAGGPEAAGRPRADQFEGADASFELLARKRLRPFSPSSSCCITTSTPTTATARTGAPAPR